MTEMKKVSVPFTSGSSLQPTCSPMPALSSAWFQFPLHRDPRCNSQRTLIDLLLVEFQFPLHRDPRCNLKTGEMVTLGILFQFPLHRDPRCNLQAATAQRNFAPVSVPFTSGSSLQPVVAYAQSAKETFQFPLHRDPRCNKPKRDSSA